jgi:hypothetical protein
MARIKEEVFTNYDYESISVTDTAIGFTEAKISKGINSNKIPQSAMFSIETASIRIRMDGTAPTASTGLLLTAGTVVTVLGETNIKRFKAIRSGSTSATIEVLYFTDNHSVT